MEGNLSPHERMSIDYLAQSEKYRPGAIETLLIGEAPPPNGKRYFYLPTTMGNNLPIERNCSLPATIFHHYFKTLPADEEEYHELLLRLKQLRVFLVDIVDEPTRVRGSPDGVRRVIEAIPKLRAKLKRRTINIEDKRIVFLLARNKYRKEIRKAFPESSLVPWMDFRMGTWRNEATG